MVMRYDVASNTRSQTILSNLFLLYRVSHFLTNIIGNVCTYVGMFQNTPKRLYVCRYIFFENSSS